MSTTSLSLSGRCTRGFFVDYTHLQVLWYVGSRYVKRWIQVPWWGGEQKQDGNQHVNTTNHVCCTMFMFQHVTTINHFWLQLMMLFFSEKKVAPCLTYTFPLSIAARLLWDFWLVSRISTTICHSYPEVLWNGNESVTCKNMHFLLEQCDFEPTILDSYKALLLFKSNTNTVYTTIVSNPTHIYTPKPLLLI